MDPMIFVLIAVGLAVAIGFANRSRLAGLQDSMQQIVPRHDVVVNAYAAMAECPYTKTEVEKMILARIAEDDTIRNVSREDVRVVMHEIGEVFRKLNPEERIGQAREVPSW